MAYAPLSSLAFHERIRRELSLQSDLIPSMPEVVVEALRLINAPDTDLVEFEACLRNDAPLVARLLKIVNSPFYGLRNPVTTIKDGVGVLGLRSLRSLVLAAGAASYLERNYACYGHDTRGLWLHSIVVAAGSKTLSAQMGGSRQEQEELFLAGLLHDIGKLLLGPYLSEIGKDVIRGEVTGVAGEEQILGIDHCAAGNIVAQKWNLTPLVLETVQHHHGDQAILSTSEFGRQIAMVRVADWYAHKLGRGYQPNGAPAAAESAVRDELQHLGVPAQAFKEMGPVLDEAIQLATTSLSNLTS